jgi:hypothetical protein
VTAQAQLQHYHFGKVNPSRANQGPPKIGGIEGKGLYGFTLSSEHIKINIIICV